MFNFQLFSFLLVFIFLIFFSYLDIKYKKISNKFVLFFFIISFLFIAIKSIYFNDFNILLNSILLLFITFVIGFLLWNIGAFSGADIKILSVIAFLIPTNPSIFKEVFNLNIKNNLYILSLFLTAIFSFIPYFLVLSFYQLFKNKRYIIFFKNLFSKKRLISILNSFLILFLISSFFYILKLDISIIISLIFVYLIIVLFNKLENYNINTFYFIVFIIYLGLSLYSIFSLKEVFSFNYALNLIIFLFLIQFIIVFYKITHKSVFIYSKKIKDLKENDLVYYNYYLIKNKLKPKRIGFFKSIKLMLNGEYFKNLKIDPKKSKGLDKKDINLLKKHYSKNQIIYLKKTLSFIPALLIGFILTIIFGDFVLFLF